MPPPYTPEQADQLINALIDRRLMAQNVVVDFTTHPYRTREGSEFARFGLCRRMTTMWKCAEFVFDELPPEQEDVPDAENREKAIMFLQSFVLNSFGCTDCLSWIWLHEKNVRDGQGNELRRTQVGLQPNQELRKYLPDVLQQHMAAVDRWFADLKDVRDALMHRIPIYIPPYFVAPEREAAYEALSIRMNEAVAQRDLPEYHRLDAERDGLGHYLPLLTYTASVAANIRHAEIHKLLVNDLLTITDLGRRFLDELRRP